MRTTAYAPVPFSIGGVARPKPRLLTAESNEQVMRHGPQDSRGFRPMFFTGNVQPTEAEAQLRLDWDQAAARMIAAAYARVTSPDRERIVDLSI